MHLTLKCWNICSLLSHVDIGISVNEGFACYNPPSVTLVSFGCCVLLAVSLTGWCRWLVAGAQMCPLWVFILIPKELALPLFKPSSTQTGIAMRKIN